MVIDQGSYQTRVGFAMGYAPKAVFPTVVANVVSDVSHISSSIHIYLIHSFFL